MSTVIAPTRSPQPPKDDPFRLGWRYVKEITPEGEVIIQQVPLTDEDVLHPQEGDFIMITERHDRVRVYLKEAIKSFVGLQDILVLSDHRIDWGSKYGWAHGPDVVAFSDVQGSYSIDSGTFRMAKFKAKPLFVVEVTSPATRDKDFGAKAREYFLVGVPVYVIVDLPSDEEPRDITLYGFRPGATEYEALPKDDKGRVWLAAVGLWLGVEGDVVYLEDAEGNRLPGYEDLARQRQQALEDVAAQAKARRAAEEMAIVEAKSRREAEVKATAEATARQAVEAKVRELEEQLARLSKANPDA
jgi:Uma2 family endonuclease